jgi:hypothetical protein
MFRRMIVAIVVVSFFAMTIGCGGPSVGVRKAMQTLSDDFMCKEQVVASVVDTMVRDLMKERKLNGRYELVLDYVQQEEIYGRYLAAKRRSMDDVLAMGEAQVAFKTIGLRHGLRIFTEAMGPIVLGSEAFFGVATGTYLLQGGPKPSRTTQNVSGVATSSSNPTQCQTGVLTNAPTTTNTFSPTNTANPCNVFSGTVVGN